MEEDNKLQTFTLQMQLPAPNLEVAKRVADEAQRLIDIYGYYNFLNLVEFMKQNPNRSPILDYYNIHHYNDYDPQPLQYLHQI